MASFLVWLLSVVAVVFLFLAVFLTGFVVSRLERGENGDTRRAVFSSSEGSYLGELRVLFDKEVVSSPDPKNPGKVVILVKKGFFSRFRELPNVSPYDIQYFGDPLGPGIVVIGGSSGDARLRSRLERSDRELRSAKLLLREYERRPDKLMSDRIKDIHGLARDKSLVNSFPGSGKGSRGGF